MVTFCLDIGTQSPHSRIIRVTRNVRVVKVLAVCAQAFANPNVAAAVLGSAGGLRWPEENLPMATTLGSVTESTNETTEMARRSLEADQCALLVIDIQEKLLPPISRRSNWSRIRNC